jgi:hypothetical protein
VVEIVVYLAPGMYVAFLPTPEEPLVVSPAPAHPLPVRSQWRAPAGTTVFLGAAGPLTVDSAPRISSLDQFVRDLLPQVPRDSCLPSAIRGFFANGGRACYVISVAETLAELGPNSFYPDRAHRGGLPLVETLGDVSMICAPDVVRAHQLGLLDRDGVKFLYQELRSFGEMSRQAVAILDPPADLRPEEVYEFRAELGDTAYAALFYPWLRPPTDAAFVPPSGHVAGMFADADATVGPHAPPVQREIRDLHGLAVELTRNEISLLFPAGVNPIVRLGRSAGLQSARTLAAEPDWRQVAWVRTASFLGWNVSEGMGWTLRSTVRDRQAWRQLGNDLENLCDLLWRGGALSGETSSDAYRVLCDLDSSDPEAVEWNRLEAELQLSLQGPMSCRLRVVCQLG